MSEMLTEKNKTVVYHAHRLVLYMLPYDVFLKDYPANSSLQLKQEGRLESEKNFCLFYCPFLVAFLVESFFIFRFFIFVVTILLGSLLFMIGHLFSLLERVFLKDCALT